MCDFKNFKKNKQGSNKLDLQNHGHLSGVREARSWGGGGAQG